jgi:hypothetical protein
MSGQSNFTGLTPEASKQHLRRQCWLASVASTGLGTWWFKPKLNVVSLRTFMLRRDADCSEVPWPMTITNAQMLAYSSHDLEAWTDRRYGCRGSTVSGNQWSAAAGIMSLGDLVSKRCSQTKCCRNDTYLQLSRPYWNYWKRSPLCLSLEIIEPFLFVKIAKLPEDCIVCKSHFLVVMPGCAPRY